MTRIEARVRELEVRITKLAAREDKRLWRNAHRLDKKRNALIDKASRRGELLGWRQH